MHYTIICGPDLYNFRVVYHVSIVLYVSNLAYSLQQTICRLIAMASVYLTREEIFNCTLEIASGGCSVSFLFFEGKKCG